MNWPMKVGLAVSLLLAALIVIAVVPDWGSGGGPENTGRFIALFFLLPIVLLFAGVFATRGRLRKVLLCLLLIGAGGIFVAGYAYYRSFHN